MGRYLEEHHKTLADYGVPNPVYRIPEVLYELRRWGPLVPLMQEWAEEAEHLFNPEQCAVYDEVVATATQCLLLLLFVDRKAGCGKMFLVNSICKHLQGMGRIVVTTVTSASAAQLYPGGHTTHSAFKILVNDRSKLLESPIKPGSPAAELLVGSSVLIWDEAPMANNAALACMENLLCLIMQCPNIPFGGEILILLSDF
ncbi:hypothetical protein M407DRAFT_28544 [Tulasnella calospora MUT 4182]|uniref:ATP-dependent DNA helicase n=1 Tax=Tulasnella calospora MUT 4182 TaxID=1051891 RepID=A0A0C3Q187_9AGAM|nr:hypothetical protein M407DRAFT_28544 [Tulasnella calospora MUT 4182]